jgi:malonyl-CoA/methylmalonyl-CoA synthetase
VEPGDRVLLQAGTSGAMLCSYLALLFLGAPVILTGPASTEAEVAAVLHRSGASFAITEDNRGSADGVNHLPLPRLAQRARESKPVEGHRLSSDDVALIAFTSGTTGRPKGVPLTHGMLLSSIRSVMTAWQWSASDRLVHALPLYHQHGLGGIHATLIAGASAHILARFDATALAETIARREATVLFAVPTIYHRLLDGVGEAGPSLHSLRLATSGSAPMAAALFERVERELGITPLERYGLTESGLDVSNLYSGTRRPGAVGYALPGVQTKVVAPDATDLPAGHDGEIVMRGPQVFDGYLDDPDATDAAFLPGDWFRTGDMGRFDADGVLTITGRLKDLIVTGGFNVAPQEVEDVLATHPGVDEVAVSGIPDEQWGEAVAAWVVTRRPIPAPDLIAHCRRELAAFKCPKHIFVVDALPRNTMGKLQRSLLGVTK